MIVDVHTHIGKAEHYGEGYFEGIERGGTPDTEDRGLATTPTEHWEAMQSVDRAMVLGFRTKLLDCDVPNDYVAEYVALHADRLIGFMCIDPTQSGEVEELDRCYYDLGLRGIKMSPVYQGFHPQDERALPIYEKAEQLGLPIMLHQATCYNRQAPLKFANPITFDDIAIRYPDLTLIFAHLGYPWTKETLHVVRKHPHLFTDISFTCSRPWEFYNALIHFQEWRCLDKVLFGSDFPAAATPAETMDMLRKVNEVVAGTNMPRVPLEEIECIIHRDSLRLLGLA